MRVGVDGNELIDTMVTGELIGFTPSGVTGDATVQVVFTGAPAQVSATA